MTWEGIRQALNVSKKDLSSPSKLTIDNFDIFDPKIISEKFNDFLSILATKVEVIFKFSKKSSEQLHVCHSR